MPAHDLGVKPVADKSEKPAAVSVASNKIILSTTEVPELSDFNIGDKVEIKFKATVKEIARPEMKDNVVKEDEPADYTLEFVEAEVLNASADRKEAEEMGVDMPRYKKIQSKRRGRAVER